MIPGLAAYSSVTLIFALTPGATTAVVVRNAIEGGWRTGMRAALGAAGGNTCQALAAGLGLAMLVRQAPRLWTTVQVAGVAYLAWLGAQSFLRMWRGAPRAVAPTAAGSSSSGAAVRQGFLTNVLNPSIGTFYLVIVPSFLPASPPASLFALFAVVHISTAFMCHCFWAAAFNALRKAFAQPGFVRAVEGLTGAALLLLAWRLAVRI